MQSGGDCFAAAFLPLQRAPQGDRLAGFFGVYWQVVTAQVFDNSGLYHSTRFSGDGPWLAFHQLAWGLGAA